MKGDTRCVDGRLMRHDPQSDDPDLETDIGKCPECARPVSMAQFSWVIKHGDSPSSHPRYWGGYKAGVEAAAKMVQKTVDENEDINSKQFDFLVMKIETAIRAMTD